MRHAMEALGLSTRAEFARFLGLPRQSMTGRDEDAPLPDAWCWKGLQKRPDIFGPAPVSEARDAA
ncbi:hypothetical protein ATB53_00345 [Xanthomonas translucens]|uniref:Uncharacterized protein n=1 Tax=Xanthomonas campestris pv. translucens TaxID=343 RepID=A0A120EZ88_XANCT|nr:hypothetical protein ATB53_00345 [Xanthomonas translucens]